MRNVIQLFFTLVLSLVLINCSDDDNDNNSNPATPDPFAAAGTYEGKTNTGLDVKIVITDFSGEGGITSYTFPGIEVTSTSKLADVVDNSFEFQIGLTEQETVTGVIENSTIAGDYYMNSFFTSDSGSYTAVKQ